MIHHERLRPTAHAYPADEWHIIEKGFHPEFLAQLETMRTAGSGCRSSSIWRRWHTRCVRARVS
jgi:hypothetical protein